MHGRSVSAGMSTGTESFSLHICCFCFPLFAYMQRCSRGSAGRAILCTLVKKTAHGELCKHALMTG